MFVSAFEYGAGRGPGMEAEEQEIGAGRSPDEAWTTMQVYIHLREYRQPEHLRRGYNTFWREFGERSSPF